MATKSNQSLDLLLVNAPGKKRVYQDLANDLAATEPPIWAGLIAAYSRKQGLSVDILDADALLLTPEQTVAAIVDHNPILTVFVVYGQHPSASTQSMPAAGAICKLLKEEAPNLKTLFMGTHVSALPERTLREEATDFACQGEGPITITQTLRALKAGGDSFAGVPGLWYRKDGGIFHNQSAPLLQNLDVELPGMAWDLLPMERYRAHNWHCWSHINERNRYASLYTSLGCPFKCSFCCINAPFGGSGIRYFSPQHIIKELDTLVTKYNIKNIKIADEMFVLNQQHVLGLCDLIIERGYNLNIWAYARVDTIKDKFLEKMKRAGFNWLGIGIESGSKFVRDGMLKGRFGDEEIRAVVTKIRNHDIYVGANYIFGLPDDTLETMQDTLDLALSLNTEYANFYAAMAYPGSPLHVSSTQKGIPLPEDPGGPGWIGYSHYAYETFNLPTETVSAGKVLTFRDRAFNIYFGHPDYLQMIEGKFGTECRKHIEFMLEHQLPRKYAEAIG